VHRAGGLFLWAASLRPLPSPNNAVDLLLHLRIKGFYLMVLKRDSQKQWHIVRQALTEIGCYTHTALTKRALTQARVYDVLENQRKGLTG
jgi:hypothetical protein